MLWSAEVAIDTTARNIGQDGNAQSTAITLAMALDYQKKENIWQPVSTLSDVGVLVSVGTIFPPKSSEESRPTEPADARGDVYYT